MDNVHATSNRGTWETDPTLIADLSTVFSWDLDACASRANVCERFYSPAEDGLATAWIGLTWCNMPYGKGRRIDLWMQKARQESQRPETTTVCLPPARTSTRWWHNNAPFADLVVFIKGRLTFGSDEYWQWRWDTPIIDGKPNKLYRKHDHKQSAPFPSAFVVFGDLTIEQRNKLCSYGWPVFPDRIEEWKTQS